MDFVPRLTVTSLQDLDITGVDGYVDALTAACRRSPPPYGRKSYGELFRRVASNPAWLAASMAENAYREGDGANRLWSLAACTTDAERARQVKQHAVDEARHSRWYVAMLNLVFPNAVVEAEQPVLESLSPGYQLRMDPKPVEGSPFAHDLTLDDLIQMNIAEIRTCIHHLLQRTMLLHYCPADKHPRLLPILDSLLHDEKKHVGYTARLIEQHVAAGEIDLVRELFAERIRDFNEITEDEMAQSTFWST